MSETPKATAPAGDESPQSNSNITVSAEVFKEVLDIAQGKGECTEDQRQLAWWFFSYCRAQGLGYGYTEAGKALGYDSTTIYRFFHGKYGAKIGNLTDAIQRFKKITEERGTRVKLDFVETDVARNTFSACRAALVSQTVAFIYGDPQIGKTTALMEYARRNNHGQTIYVRMPASAGVQLFMKEFARSAYVSPESSFENLRDRILRRVDDKTLVIIDEAHQAFLSYQKRSQVKVLEVIREIYDRTGCGMVICMTTWGRDQFQRGSLSLLVEQLRRRGTIRLNLPSRPSAGDIAKIARKFGLDAPTGAAKDVVADMLHTSGLGMFIKFLQNGAVFAANQKQRLSWEHFLAAYDIIRKLGGGEG
jgi:DNA transposition AAA+ family ATPase